MTKKQVVSRRDYTMEQSKDIAKEILRLSTRLESCVREAEVIPMWLGDLENAIQTLKMLNVRYNTLAEVDLEGKK